MKVRTLAIASAAALIAAAPGCSGGTAQPATIPPSSAPPVSLPPVTGDQPTTTSEVPTTSTSTVTTMVPAGAVGLSDGGPWTLVDSAPGVTSPGLVYELMPKLWVFLPTEESSEDGNLFVPSPADIPIIEAYLQARLVFFRAITTIPIDLDDPGWVEFYADGGAAYFAVLEPRREQGQVVDLVSGVVLRPRVLGEGRTSVQSIVFDCTLDGAVWRMPDGSLGPGSTPGVVPNGVSSSLRTSADTWLVETVSSQAEACA